MLVTKKTYKLAVKKGFIGDIPIQSELQKWLRENRIHINIDLYIDMDRCYYYTPKLSQEYTVTNRQIPFKEHIEKTGRAGDWRISKELELDLLDLFSDTYEKGLEIGLQAGLKLLKSK